MGEKKALWAKLEKFKYPALILVVGLLLLAFPTGSGKSETGSERDLRLQELLSQTEGVGEARVLLSENGVVVICDGAENPKIRLDIIQAVGSYTGFGSDKITILKMADQS